MSAPPTLVCRWVEITFATMAEPREPPQGAGKQKPVYARRTTMDGVRLMDSAKLASYVAEARIMEHEQDRVKHGSKSELEFSASFLPESLVPMFHSKFADAKGAIPSLPCAVNCDAVLMMADISGCVFLKRVTPTHSLFMRLMYVSRPPPPV